MLLSGGIDSTTTLALARAEGFEVYALTIDYGQRHKVELDAATRVASSLSAWRLSTKWRESAKGRTGE